MALYSNLNRSLGLCCVASLRAGLPKFYNQGNDLKKSVTLQVDDTLDNFTSQLIQKKTDKWEIRKAKAQRFLDEFGSDIEERGTSKKTDYKIKLLSTDTINTLFQNAIDSEDNTTVNSLMQQCLQQRKCPSLSIIIHVLQLNSLNGDKEMIVDIQNLCKEFLPEVLDNYSNFKHYLAEAIWVKGDVTKSLQIFDEVYRTNAFLRRRIRLMLKYLILDIVNTRSEAALVNIIKFSESLLCDFKDFYPLTCIWQACFLSEWYTDQCLALELLERNKGLCGSVINRISYVVSVSLRSHRTEVVYRLLELLLKYEMKMQYSGVLLALLDYQFRRGDLQSCSEIIRWSIKNNVELPTIHHEKFLKLLLEVRMLPNVETVSDIQKIPKDKNDIINKEKRIVTKEYKF